MAANIDEAIAEAAEKIAAASLSGAVSLFDQWELWIAGVFSEATGIFPPSVNTPNRRAVRDWVAAHVLARAVVEGEGTGNTDTTSVSVAACADACARVLSAVKFAVINGEAEASQETDMVTLFNSVWP